MSGASSPEILAAYDAVRSDKDPTNWLLISYAGAVGDALKLSATGSGGLDELKEKLDDGQAQYAYARIECVDFFLVLLSIPLSIILSLRAGVIQSLLLYKPCIPNLSAHIPNVERSNPTNTNLPLQIRKRHRIQAHKIYSNNLDWRIHEGDAKSTRKH